MIVQISDVQSHVKHIRSSSSSTVKERHGTKSILRMSADCDPIPRDDFPQSYETHKPQFESRNEESNPRYETICYARGLLHEDRGDRTKDEERTTKDGHRWRLRMRYGCPVWTVVKNRTMVKRRLGQRLAHEGALGKVPASASNIDLRLSA
ncbi:hypothetical protein MPTK1_7g16520 [Marchantia polymorpha subsp. ruderalis]|uniref:Uncharacterized protein n=2 Tax=Marchantia polymorpha TaxID=3197 RepID=A0AAF6C0E0_MARPO|nr:hypothetical protein MARPO_0123s0034 [Marchantia polymorpha]BBN17724.1 hypothetical protein Mp_7g16520 [Marchantia polymorpha subsp. ruderalis]|eukprot:PTQ30547.1 hypothetical protein MARPO_0123s0034 [Marchantia polymorpha]